MPKNEAGNLHIFETEELYQVLGHEFFGKLLTKDEVAKLSPEAKKDYVKYKIHVYEGVNL